MTGVMTPAPATGPTWKAVVAPYARPHIGRSLLDLATSAVPYLFFAWLMYKSLAVGYWLTLLLAVPGSGFLLRTYIVFHDCAHGSFLPSKRANVWLGRVLGLLVYSPYAAWKHSHAVHHATSGDLDRRGTGDVPTLTVAEYRARPWAARVGYRLFRNPLVMFGIGPLYALALQPRFFNRRMRPRILRSTLLTNVALTVVIGLICWGIGWRAFIGVQLPMAILAATAGVFLFYVQHQFEDVYWRNSGDWDYAEAALRGASHLRLPRVLQFFSGNIGLHHVHHLSARIPNYNLQRAHDENPIFHDVPTLSLWDGLRATRLKLYDEDAGRLVTWRQARRPAR
jgi:omega-6 fatty acid desaturase (delta-12 desaturase)